LPHTGLYTSKDVLGHGPAIGPQLIADVTQRPVAIPGKAHIDLGSLGSPAVVTLGAIIDGLTIGAARASGAGVGGVGDDTGPGVAEVSEVIAGVTRALAQRVEMLALPFDALKPLHALGVAYGLNVDALPLNTLLVLSAGGFADDLDIYTLALDAFLVLGTRGFADDLDIYTLALDAFLVLGTRGFANDLYVYTLTLHALLVLGTRGLTDDLDVYTLALDALLVLSASRVTLRTVVRAVVGHTLDTDLAVSLRLAAEARGAIQVSLAGHGADATKAIQSGLAIAGARALSTEANLPGGGPAFIVPSGTAPQKEKGQRARGKECHPHVEILGAEIFA
jgi:hypothetical protein